MSLGSGRRAGFLLERLDGFDPRPLWDIGASLPAIDSGEGDAKSLSQLLLSDAESLPDDSKSGRVA
jgi:hypothetical protein